MGLANLLDRDAQRCIAARLLLSVAVAWSTAPAAAGQTSDVLPKIRAAPPEQLARCLPFSASPTGEQRKLKVVATISPAGKAVDPRFPPDIEPWLETAARCVLELMQFDPATRDGVPIAAVATIPIVLELAAAPTLVRPRFKRDETGELSDCYSRTARRAGAEGKVHLELTVGSDGRVGKYELPPGIEPWQKATAECVIPRLRFEPATLDGKPFAARLTFPLTFDLEGNDPLTLAKLNASRDEIESATRRCYPAGNQSSATPHYKVTINVRGFPSQVMLVESSGDKALDKSGACILKKLSFQPAKRGERPVMSTLLVPMTVRPPNPQ